MNDILTKHIRVPATPDRAFELFTAHIGSWWPLATHSVGGDDATTVAFVDGKIVETVRDGATHVWGTVTKWDPPGVVAFTWHPGLDPQQATAVEVRFTAMADGTEVELVHSGWTSRPDWAQAYAGYDKGWNFVLGHLVDYAR